jgi:predicted SAM-dependent methyltransferase
MKSLLRAIVRPLGYDIQPLPDTVDDRQLYSQLYPASSVAGRLFYNIGAGGFSHPCWTNIDYQSEWYARNAKKTRAGISYDLLSLEPMPLAEDSAEIIYTSHTIEHITDDAAHFVFNECRRCLKPGGTLRITAPDIDLDHQAYCDKDRQFFYWAKRYSKPRKWRKAHYNGPLDQASLEQLFLIHFATSTSMFHADGAPERVDDEAFRELLMSRPLNEALDHCTAMCPLDIQRRYPGNHINWWNHDKLTAALSQAGFTQIQRSAYGQSRCPVLRNTNHFDSTHPKLSLYVEASA